MMSHPWVVGLEVRRRLKETAIFYFALGIFVGVPLGAILGAWISTL